MDPDDFRRIALGMEGAIEGAHMGHPDFRIAGRVFATIRTGHQSGMVTLTPDQQQRFLEDHPAAFAPESGAWGRAGCTRVRLEAIDEETLGEAMTLAAQNAQKKGVPKNVRMNTGRKRATGRSTSRRTP